MRTLFLSITRPLAFLFTASRSPALLSRRQHLCTAFGFTIAAWPQLPQTPQRRPFLPTTSSTQMSFAMSTSSTETIPSSSVCDTSLGPSNLNVYTGYLNATAAAALDEELMSTPGFSVDQLMELAGLSVAQAVYTVVQEQQSSSSSSATEVTQKPRILIVAGPGNNGGDGLVAARHLYHFGYDCTVVYPKRSSKQLFVNLIQQCEDLGIAILPELPIDFPNQYTAVVDAIFGFSFTGEPREPFASILQQIIQAKGQTIVLSVDIPSGWHVDQGDVSSSGFVPDVLISLTVPKECAKYFPGRHFVGGRFVPPALANKYGIRMPPYPGTSQVMEVAALSETSSSSLLGTQGTGRTTTTGSSVSSL